MFELKNFYVKRDGQFLIEDVNQKFFFNENYILYYSLPSEKDAFIGGLLGFRQYLTFGKIIWDCKWKLEDKETDLRMRKKFFWFTDKFPDLNPIDINDYLSSLTKNKEKIHKLQHLLRISDDTIGEKFNLQMLELFILHPKVVIIDIEKFASISWGKIREYPNSLTKLIFIKEGTNSKLPIKTDKNLLLSSRKLKFI